MLAVIQFRANPKPVVQLGCLECGSSSTEGIEHNVVLIGRHEDRSLGDREFELVDTWAYLESRMTVRRGILPEIREVQP